MRRGLLAPVLTAALVAAAVPALTVTASAAPVPARASSAVAADLLASDPALSADGRWVVFVGEVGGVARVHRHDTLTGETRVVAPGLEPGQVADPSVSDDGRWVVLTHRSPGEPSQVIWADMRHDSFRRVSVTSEWEPGNGDSWAPAISGDGRWAVFTTEATDVVAKPHWGAGSAPGADVVLAEPVHEGFVVTLVSPEREGVDFSSAGIDADGRRIAFSSSEDRVLVASRNGRQVTGATDVGRGRTPDLGADGTALAVVRPQPVHPGGPERSATWLRAVRGGAELQVDVDERGWALPGDSAQPRVSADGARVLMTHRTGAGHELVLRDVARGATVTVADRVDAAAGSDLSADGRWAAHVSDGTLQLTPVDPLVSAARVEAPRAMWPALVMRAATPARGPGYVIAAVPGQWEPVRGATVRRQWLRDGRPIRRATRLTYEITAADVGSELALREWLEVPGLPTGVSTSRAYKVKPDRAVLRVPGRVVRPRPGAVRLRVRVATLPGGETYVDGAVVPQGRVRVRVGSRTVTRQVTARGWVSVRLPRQQPGRKVVRVQHVGTPYVTSAPTRKVRLVVRPRR